MKRQLLLLSAAFLLLFSSCKKHLNESNGGSTDTKFQFCGVVNDVPLVNRNKPMGVADSNSSVAPYYIMINYNGYSYNTTDYPSGGWGAPFTVPASGLIAGQESVILDHLKEDWRDYQVIFTTNEADWQASSPGHRTRVVVTSGQLSRWGNVGGIAFIGSAIGGTHTEEPCWVNADLLSYTPYIIAYDMSHELGHTLNLPHYQQWDESTCTLISDYQPSIGEPSTLSWAPLMGFGNHAKITTFAQHAPYNSLCNNYQDEYTEINKTITYVSDPDRNTLISTPSLTLRVITTTIPQAGTIGFPGDLDLFRLSGTSGATYRLLGTTLYSAQETDLDLQIDVYTAPSISGTLTYLTTFADVGTADINDLITIPAGKTVFLQVKAQATSPYVNTPNSLTGQYTLSLQTYP